MSTVNATDGRKNFFDLIDRANHQERIAIERHGKPVAAIISYQDLAKLEALEDAIATAQLEQAIVSYEDLAKLEALEDAIATAQLKQAMAESTGLITVAELLAMGSNG